MAPICFLSDYISSLSQENPVTDQKRRALLYTVASGVGAAGVATAVVPFVRVMQPAADTLAAAVTEFDVSTIDEGMMKTIPWRGQPVFVLHRTPAMLATLHDHDELLRDPMSQAIPEVQADWMITDEQRIARAIKPEFLVVSAVCTHLGCVPGFMPTAGQNDWGEAVPVNWPGGWHCACHGSNYDLSGRVFKEVPAPYNLFIPPYKYINDTTILIG